MHGTTMKIMSQHYNHCISFYKPKHIYIS